ncbi:short-chain fatty acid transporter [Winogradskyella sp. DF17]|uniref:Short-chain fatty acid transporter n=1 Tax=Winogradskyella pelagia TaxID=2819984 RepID=A0ABS3T170_9FLAO|nr:TIGR00366 family protein [Winogradskyella sp. DF17]MBO3116488.1 short-chain fatty acid transporter [Winogradskyella sp. DF17]
MITKIGQKFTDLFTRFMPSSFVFALLLTLITAIIAFVWTGSSPLKIIASWYDGFFDLLTFGMQITLIIITGFSIALSPVISRYIDTVAKKISNPKHVYVFVVFIGAVLSLVSFGWIVITAVLARELALRVKGVNYPFLIACVYFSGGSWVCGLSSSIPLLLNTEANFLIEREILSTTIPTAQTLTSPLNLAMLFVFLIIVPLIAFIIVPKGTKVKELKDLLSENPSEEDKSIAEEAESFKLPFKTLSDALNNSSLLQFAVALLGVVYIAYYFYTNSFDLNFNIMIFIFIIIGLLLHKTPMQFSIAMKRSSSNISGILFQYPFYAGIMGIMLYTGLGDQIADLMSSVATKDSYPFFAYVTGGFMNFAIPSAGGEFAVVGPSIIEAVKSIAQGLSPEQMTQMVSRASLSIAYGESTSNLLQPFYLLLVFPVMGKGIKIQARDVMGYLVIPFIFLFVIQSLLVIYMPI